MSQVTDDDRAAYGAWYYWQEATGAQALVAAAVLAPSPHNNQPWTFRIDEGGIEIWPDESQRLGTLDPTDRELHISLGTAVENLVLTAAARGSATRVTVVDDPVHVRIDLEPAPGALAGPGDRPRLYEAIGERRTNRGPFTEVAVPAGLLADFSRQAGPTDGLDVRWLTDWSQRDAFGELLVEAAEAVAADAQQSADNYRWYRHGVGDIVRNPEGLTQDAQGLGAVKRAIAKALPPGSREEVDRFWVKQTKTVHTATASAYGLVLSTDPDSVEQRVAGGRLLQRMELAATLRGLAFHPMTQITQRIDRDRTLGREPAFGPRIAELVAPSQQQLLINFRVGYPVRSARRSPRRPVASFLR
ncbi:Acg family FMN-binding oxidoreductase [Microlunatus ginsengisoli]|uniref:Nitroreductase n=1 Tax=Microlunatus ginsengisoli TaxID=363863 RepID=A0ABP6Z9Q9_9ACTN